MDRKIIAEEVLAAVGGKENVAANDICMTRLRILTEDPSLVDTDQLSSARGVLGFVRRGTNGIEVVFGPGKVEAVHEALVDLTGIQPNEELFDDVPAGGQSRPIKVHISPNALRNAAISQQADEAVVDDEPVEAEASVEELVSMLDDIQPEIEPEQTPDQHVRHAAARVLVINGPNINMLGIREPDIYGHDSYQAMLKTCHAAAKEAGFAECTCFQSNHEGDLIDAIQDAYGTYAGIIINPGAYTHTSIAILDAAKAVGLPMIEVHISKLEDRESFRQISYIRAACFETITGLGVEGYRKAMMDMAAHLGL